MNKVYVGPPFGNGADPGPIRDTLAKLVIRAMSRFAMVNPKLDPPGNLNRLADGVAQEIAVVCGHPVLLALNLGDDHASQALTWGNPTYVSFGADHVIRSACRRATLAFSPDVAMISIKCRDLLEPLLDVIAATFARVEKAEREPVRVAPLAKRTAHKSLRPARLSHDRGGAVFQFAPVAMVIVHAQSLRILRSNMAFLRLSNQRPEKLSNQSLLDYFDPSTIKKVREELVPAVKGFRIRPKTEKVVSARLRNFEARGLPVGLQAVMVPNRTRGADICLIVQDRREQSDMLDQLAIASEVLKARYDFIECAAQAVEHGILLLDPAGRVVWSNTASRGMFRGLEDCLESGAPINVMFKTGVERGIFPDAEGNERLFLGKVFADLRKVNAPFQIERIGNQRLQFQSFPVKGHRTVVVIYDVTVQSAAERRLRQVVEGSQVGTWELDIASRRITINSRFAWVLGYSPSDLGKFTLDDLLSRVHPSELDATCAAFAAVCAGVRERLEITVQIRHRHGFYVWLQLRGRMVARSNSGGITGIAGVSIDVSQLKRAEQRLEQIVEGVDVGAWQYDARSGLCRINDRAAKILGYARKDLEPVTRKSISDFLHPDDDALIDALFNSEQIQRDEQFSIEIRFRHKLGHWVWVLCRGRINERDAAGVPFLSSGVLLDISSRKALEGELRQERDFLATLADASDSGILVVNTDAKILFANRAVGDLLGCKSEDLINLYCHPDTMGLTKADGSGMTFAELPCQIARRADQPVRNLRICKNFEDGRTKIISVNSVPFESELHGRLIMCTLQDVTAIEDAQANLRAETRRAEQANKAKSDFLAAISHELRTPLHGILGMTELLDREESFRDQGDLVRAIRESGQHLLSVVNDLLDLNKAESGHLTLELGPVNLGELASRIEDLHGRHARSLGLEFKVTVDRGAQSTRLGDGQRLMQILHNIVGNAVKFTPRGTVHLDIRGQHSAMGDGVVIRVTDTGIGMSDRQIQGAWNAFGVHSAGSVGRFASTGLGLSIVRKMVDRMGGSVSLDSRLGEGTTVSVELSLPIASHVGIRTDQNRPRTEVSRLTAGKTALIADDNATNRLILSTALRKLGLTVKSANGGNQALVEAVNGDFDIVFLDISMPDKSGAQVMAEMFVCMRGNVPPVIAVTAHAMQHELDRYRALGFTEVVTKPIDMIELTKALHLALSEPHDPDKTPSH